MCTDLDRSGAYRSGHVVVVTLETVARDSQASSEPVQLVVARVADQMRESHSVMVGVAPHRRVDKDGHRRVTPVA